MKRIFILTWLLLLNLHSSAQHTPYYEEGTIMLKDICKLVGFESEEETVSMVKKITDALGMPRNPYSVRACYDINNALAVVYDDKQWIVYDPKFMKEITSKGDKYWQNLSILAHEVAHHVLGHTDNSKWDMDLINQQEKEADNYSGFILCKLGATLEQAQEAVGKTRNIDCSRDNVTHPCRRIRKTEVKKGYQRANCNGSIKPKPPREDASIVYEPGKCYAKCTIQDKYDTVTETVEVKAGTTRLVSKEPYYSTKTERIQISADTTKWVKKKADFNCQSQDPDDCKVWCLVEVPAQYKTITKKVNIGCDGSGIANSGCLETVYVPAQYETVTKRVLVEKGGFSEWREVFCDNKISATITRQIQGALRARGYDPGPSDNVIGSKTKSALIQFQKDNGLPTGNLNMETLKALGLKY